MKEKVLAIAFLIVTFTAATVSAETVVSMYRLSSDGTETKIGEIKAEQSPFGVLFFPNLTNLEPGLHGFHLHETGNCSAKEKDGHMMAGLAAGGHYDPQKTNAHRGPYEEGHLGDLPALYVDAGGVASHPVLAPRLTLGYLEGRALMIHAGGDNYADSPKPLGGGGARVACGVVDK